MGHVSIRGARISVGARTLFERLDLDILPGEFWALVGPNGVGKTTLLRAIAGLNQMSSGDLLVDGICARKRSPRERARHIALLRSDAPAPSGMSVRDVVSTGRFAARPWWRWDENAEDLTATAEALARVGLTGLADRAFETLSSGERQRAWLALALAQGARTILLDEPTSHLDVRYAREILGLLRNVADGGTTVVAVLHDLDEAVDFSDRIALFGHGTLLASGPPRQALTPQSLSAAYAIPFETFEVGGAYRIVPSSASRAPSPR
ncbi:MAG TPA: ABC transporter ATP-binding protein [Candidatus Baltobacteraceae bacterium]